MIEPIPMTPEEEQAVAEAIDRVAEEAYQAREDRLRRNGDKMTKQEVTP